jgi:hypothetical protein
VALRPFLIVIDLSITHYTKPSPKTAHAGAHSPLNMDDPELCQAEALWWCLNYSE